MPTDESIAAAAVVVAGTGLGLGTIYKVTVTGVAPSVSTGLKTTSVFWVDTVTPSGTVAPSTCALADSSRACGAGSAAKATPAGNKSSAKIAPYFMVKS